MNAQWLVDELLHGHAWVETGQGILEDELHVATE